MTRRGRYASLLVLVVLALFGGQIIAPPAQAVAGNLIMGHRCRIYDAATTNEDTVQALIDVSVVPGVSCELDAWKLKDGTVIIWHDSTWGRVSDHSTLPAGVLPTSYVSQATWAQVSQIRTKGGQPVARLTDFIDASALYHVPLVVEVKNSITNPAAMVAYAQTQGADVSYYRQPTNTCGIDVLTQLLNAGARIGIKTGGGCIFTPAQYQAMGVTFVTTTAPFATKSYCSGLAAYGVSVYSHVTFYNWKTVLANGAAKIFVDNPIPAANWK